MQYVFKQTHSNPDGSATIPEWAVSRWQRQMQTPYKDLPESEKESDRAEADKIFNITSTELKEALRTLTIQATGYWWPVIFCETYNDPIRRRLSELIIDVVNQEQLRVQVAERVDSSRLKALATQLTIQAGTSWPVVSCPTTDDQERYALRTAIMTVLSPCRLLNQIDERLLCQH